MEEDNGLPPAHEVLVRHLNGIEVEERKWAANFLMEMAIPKDKLAWVQSALTEASIKEVTERDRQNREVKLAFERAIRNLELRITAERLKS